MNKPKVLISILNWNAPENTAKTVDSVLASCYDYYTIIILDNHSQDNSVQFLKERYPAIELIQTRKNLGYAGAHKILAEKAIREGYHLFWILNNDVEVFSDSLSELIEAHKRSTRSIIGSLSLHSDGLTINSGGGHEMIDSTTADEAGGYNIYKGKNICETDVKERPVSGIQGSSMLIPVEIINMYGFMNTRFFLYGEETEYCYRLRVKHGIQTIVAANSRVIHHGGGSFEKNKRMNWVREYYATRNDILVHRKYSKSFNTSELTFKRIPSYLCFFLKHFLFTTLIEKDDLYWQNYYKKLGKWHALLNLNGRYLKPENFLE